MWLHTTLEGPWPHYMMLEVLWDNGLWTLSFGALTISWSWLLAHVWSDPYGCERPVTWYSIHQSLISSFSCDTRQPGKASYRTWYVCILLGYFTTSCGHPFDWIQILLPFTHFPIRMPPKWEQGRTHKMRQIRASSRVFVLTERSSSLLLGFAMATSTIHNVQWILGT
jgi:hypothetical protein